MSLQNPYAKYRQTQAITASQFKLIIMLHDGAIRALQQAIPATEAKDYESMSKHFNKATAIVGHLMGSVKPDTGEIAQNLSSIYMYCLQRITEANATEDVSITLEIIGHIRSIRDAWVQVETNKAGDVNSGNAANGERLDLSFAA